MKLIILFLGLPAVGKDTLFKIAKEAWKFERAEFIERVDFELEIKRGIENGLDHYRNIRLTDIEDNPFTNAYDYELMKVDILERKYLTKSTSSNKKYIIFAQHLMASLVKIRYYYKTGLFEAVEYRTLKRRIIDFCIRHRIIPTDVVLLKASKRVLILIYFLFYLIFNIIF